MRRRRRKGREGRNEGTGTTTLCSKVTTLGPGCHVLVLYFKDLSTKTRISTRRKPYADGVNRLHSEVDAFMALIDAYHSLQVRGAAALMFVRSLNLKVGLTFKTFQRHVKCASGRPAELNSGAEEAPYEATFMYIPHLDLCLSAKPT